MGPWIRYLLPILVGVAAVAHVGGRAARVSAPRLTRAGLVVVGPSWVVTDHDDRRRPATATFPLRNPGGRPVRIGRVRTSCTCTSAVPDERTVAPGGVAAVVVRVERFEPDQDRFDAHAYIETDAGTVPVRLSGRLPPPDRLLFQPRALSFAEQGGEQTVLLRVPKPSRRRIADSDLEIVGPWQAAAQLIARGGDGAYDEYTVRVTVDDASVAGGGQGALRVSWGREVVAIPIVVAVAQPGGTGRDSRSD